MDLPDTSYKTETIKTYNCYPDDFDKKFDQTFRTFVVDKADRFAAGLTGNRILDAGSGPGNHASYFQDKGFDVFCIDNSEAMIRLCIEKGLDAQVMDLESLELPRQSFDGVWAYASLLHLPKQHIPAALEALTTALKPKGLFAASFKEGRGEGMKQDKRYPGTKRWFSYFEDQEIQGLFAPDYELLYLGHTPATETTPFLHYLFRRRT